jgi:hypothetical protein
MSKMIKHMCLPLFLFVAFIAAGSIGLYFESMHNDLVLSTATFVTSFGGLSATAARIWYSFT